MKKLIVFLGLIAMGIAQSCSNEIVLNEDWKDITIIYGLLDASDSVQYIRIEKAFLDENTSALILAQEGDSLFHENINVSLQAISESGQGGGFLPIERVDANAEGLQKEEGVFATAPNYVYKVTEEMKPSFIYKLIIEKGDGGTETETITDVIGDFDITFPLVSSSNFIRFESNRTQRFTWKPEEDAAFYDVMLRMNYLEANVSDPDNFTAKSADWVMAQNIIRQPGESVNRLFQVEIDGANYYKWVQSELEEGDFIRELVDFDLFIYAGGVELDNYINAGRVSSGLTSVEILPTYTNVTNGLGIFSTRYTKTEIGLLPNGRMLDTLATGPYTRNLGFR